MGTNFYWVTGEDSACPTCGHHKKPERKHIGKSSAGWAFALHVYPEDGLNNLADWEEVWKGKGVIVNEYGERKTAAEMRSWIVTTTPWQWRHALVDGKHCIGKEESWDLLVGEFS